MTNIDEIHSAKKVKERLSREPVLVQGPGFRCMAYQDDEGKWRSFWDAKPLPHPIHLLEPQN